MLSFVHYLLTVFTLFSGFGFLSSNKKEKEDKHSGSQQQLSSSAPNRLSALRRGPASRNTSSERLNNRQGSSAKDGENGQAGSPASKTQPIAIQSSRKRSATVRSRTGSAYSLHSTTSHGTHGSHGSGGSRRLGHGTPHSGSRSVIGSFLSGSAGSGPSVTPRSGPLVSPQAYSKSHEAVWNQAYRNSCR